MTTALAPHLIAPEVGNVDRRGRRWCALCRLSEDNRIHVPLPRIADPTKARILGEKDSD